MTWLRRGRPGSDGSGSGPEAAPPPEADTWTAEMPGAAESPWWPSSEPIVVGAPTPLFEPRAVDAEHRTPYRADTLIDGWSCGPFTIRAASLRGHLHRYNGAPRQDDLAVAVTEDRQRLVVAVADGVSGAPHSHVGSSSAVRYAVQWLADPAAGRADETNWDALFKNTAWMLTERAAAVLSLEQVDAEEAERALATTLTCVVCEQDQHGGLRAVVSGVGDSGAWVLDEDGFLPVLGGKEASASGLASSAVSGLPRVPNEAVSTSVVIRPGQVLLVGTDGFGDPLGSGDGEVGGLFTAVLSGRVPSQIEFAHALDFSRETFDDDRTLVAIWPRGN
ncbi:protein phosphatase 2C domain-containing protein [Nocardia harenae]|uniref:protein phosphatase 2C domain-containing protein n=1 Tax=Nocardia harenae TaxID=358707 RepID=UPI000A00E719|nr:protein phosphatase 2C domain-containing protein [Nocardia harenae]